jgi:hypothetical protein
MARISSFSTKKYLILAAVSLLLSLVIIRWHSVDNVSFCTNVPGCQNEQPSGKITERTYGFPLTYKKVTTFRPSASSNSTAASSQKETSIENQAFSVPSVIVSAIFWFGLLQLLSRFLKPKAAPAATSDSQEAVLPNSPR